MFPTQIKPKKTIAEGKENQARKAEHHRNKLEGGKEKENANKGMGTREKKNDYKERERVKEA